MPEKRPALGRGLSALIPDTPTPPGAQGAAEVDLDLLEPNRFQPRLQIDEARLDELAQSIRSNGVIQPILVRRAGARYEIIAGERRWRAAQRAGLLKVPVVVRQVPDERLLQVALIENIQRENLNPIDEALAYERLIREFALTQDGVAQAVGKDRSSVANYLRLLNLSDSVKALVASGALAMGHARALLGVEDPARQAEAARAVVDKALSVRETEALVRKLASPPPDKAPAATPRADVHTRQAEEKLKLSLGTRVRIVRKGRGGRIVIEFVSEDELHRLYEALVTR
jgi:ParB family transcriptional regulator, chromosome partitioning protein